MGRDRTDRLVISQSAAGYSAPYMGGASTGTGSGPSQTNDGEWLQNQPKKGKPDGLLTRDTNSLTGPPNTQVTVTDGLRIQQPVIDPTLAQRLEGRTSTDNPGAMPVTLQQR